MTLNYINAEVSSTFFMYVDVMKQTTTLSESLTQNVFYLHAFFLLWHLMSTVVNKIELTSNYYRNAGNKRITRGMKYLKQKSMNKRTNILSPKFSNYLLTTKMVGWPLLGLG